MLSDSLLRKLPTSSIKNCVIIPRPGKNFYSMRVEIEKNFIDISKCKVIGLLIGTNDISDWVFCQHGRVGYRENLKWFPVPKVEVTWDRILKNIEAFIDAIRVKNPGAVLVISSIIPRLGDWEWSRDACIALSDSVQEWCCKQQAQGLSVIFTPTHKFFLKNGKPMPELFWKDGIHLSAAGLGRVRQSLQQALSDSNLQMGGAWKRRPQGRGPSPGNVRTGVRVGNNIMF